MSDFAAYFAVADGILDASFGESFTVTPKADKPGDPNARKVSTLQPTTFTGIWDEPRTKAYPHNNEGHRDTATQRIGTGKPIVDYQVAAVPYPIQKDYVVTRLSDGTLFTVSDVTPDGLTRALLSLTARTN